MATPRSPITWTDYSGGDANFVIGCEPVSAGCKNCYACAIIEKRGGRDFSQVRSYPAKLSRLGQARFEPGDAPYRRGPGSRPMDPPGDNQRKYGRRLAVDSAWIYDQHVNQGRTTQSIADELGCHRTTIDNRIRVYRRDHPELARDPQLAGQMPAQSNNG